MPNFILTRKRMPREKGKRKRKNFEEWTYDEVQAWLTQAAQEKLRLNVSEIQKVRTLATSGDLFALLSQEQLKQQVSSKGLEESIAIDLFNLLQEEILSPEELLELRRKRLKKFEEHDELPGQPLDMQNSLGQFFQALSQITSQEITYLEQDQTQVKVNILSLPPGVYWWGDRDLGSHLFVRKSYLELETMINIDRLNCQNEIPTNWGGFVITGTPGIGKSFFLPYLFWRWYKDYQNIVINLDGGETSILYQRKDSEISIRIGKSQDFFSLITYYNRNSTLHLYDDKKGHTIPSARSFTVAACSLNRFAYSRFIKMVKRTQRYMPLWSLEELEVCRASCYPSISSSDLELAYEKWGGVIRYTLIKTEDEEDLNELESAIKDISFKMTIKVACTSMTDNEIEEFIHHLLHLEVIKTSKIPFTKTIVKFASNYVADRIIAKLHQDQLTTSIKFIKESVDELNLATLRGQLFEVLVHRQIVQGVGPLKIKCLEESKIEETKKKGRKKKVEQKDTQKEITLLSRELKILDQLSSFQELQDHQYGRPRSKRFAVADGFLPPDAFIQITVSPQHGLKAQQSMEIVQTFLSKKPSLEKIKCYFIVPPDIFPHFEKQSFLNLNQEERKRDSPLLDKIEQWVICLDT